MMNEKEYIKSIVSVWMEKFSDIESIRYAYDDVSGFHIVEVSPASVRTENELFAEEESNFWMNFMAKYPNSDLLVSEPSDVNDMSNIIYESSPKISEIVSSFGDFTYNCLEYDNSYSFDTTNYSIAA